MTYYFGKPDARHEVLSHLYPELFSDSLDQIKRGTNPDGKYLIGGIRGSGKTALRILFAQRLRKDEPKSLSSVIDRDRVLPSNAYLDSPSLYFHLVANWLLIQVHNLYATAAGQPGRLSLVTDRIRDALGKLVTATTLKAGGVELSLNLAGLQGGSLPVHVSELRISHYRELLGKIEGLAPAYILIDDFDTVFEGSSQREEILYAALDAVGAINEEMENVHVVAFVNLVLQRQYVRSSSEARKHRTRATEIAWSEERLSRLIASRIAQVRHVAAARSDQELWKLEFTNAAKLRKGVLRMNMSGPSDLIELCNLARDRAKADRIAWKDFESVLLSFVETKLDDIRRDFGDVYPGVDLVIRLVFSSCATFRTRKELFDVLRSLRVRLKARDEVPREAEGWFLEYRLPDLVRILFETGCVGVGSGKRVTFFRDDPSLALPESSDTPYKGHPLMVYWAAHQEVEAGG